MLTWVTRTVRGAFLIALVFAVVSSANYLMASARSAPSAAIPSDSTPAEVVTLPAEGASQSPDTDVVTDETAAVAADETAADQPIDFTSDLADAIRAAAPSADAEPALEQAEIVPLAAPVAPEASEQAASDAASGPYKRTVVARLGYGSGATSIGLSTGAGRRPSGPMSFSVDAAGTIYVSDNVNGRVQVYSGQGSHARSLKVDGYVYDLTTGGANDLYLLGSDGAVVIQDATTGKTKAKGSAAGSAEELGKLRLANGQLTLETPRQVAYPITVGQPGSMQILSSKAQADGQGKGAPTRSQDRYTTNYRDGGHLYRLDSKGKTLQDIALRLSDIATIVFLQEDRAGNVYVQVERVSNGQVKVEIRQFSKKGELVSVVPIDSIDYVPMTRSTIVTDDGTIYQLVPSAQGITLVKYKRS